MNINDKDLYTLGLGVMLVGLAIGLLLPIEFGKVGYYTGFLLVAVMGIVFAFGLVRMLRK